MISRSIILAGLVVAAAMTVAAQSTAAPFTAAASPDPIVTAHTGTTTGFQERHARYQLRKGDTFDLDFTLTPEFNQTVAVQPDGYVTLKGVGSLFVEGETVPELTKTLTTAYEPILHKPVIAVSLKDFEKPYYIASGQVAKPGKYDLRGDLTVTEGVAIAGGFEEKSKHSQVVLFRPLPTGGFQTKLINVKKLLASRDLSEDIRLEPGDLLYVPQNSFSKIRPFLPTSAVSAYFGPGVL
jgi:polysaccharide export outer membrane protein